MTKNCETCKHDNNGFCDEPSNLRCVDFELWEPKEPETVKDPKARHYDVGGIETLDVIKAKLTHDQYQGFLLGNILKYSCRANFKGQTDRDIEKIEFYSMELGRMQK